MNEQDEAENLRLHSRIVELKDELDHKRNEVRELKAVLEEQAKLLIRTCGERDQAERQREVEFNAKLDVQKQVARLQDEVGRLNLAASAEKPLVKLDPEREALLTELQADAIRQDAQRRAVESQLHKTFMERQLKSMEGEADYRAFIREQTARQTAAMEKIAYLLLERLPQ